MNSAAAALLGSLIGALAAVSGSVITNMVSLANERRRQESAARQAYVQLVRDRCGICFGSMFRVIQEIEWMCWYAKHAPDEIDAELIKSYENRVNEAYGSLMSAIAMTASLSLSAHKELNPHLTALYTLEERVGIASRMILTERDAATADLRTCAQEAKVMRDQLPELLHDTMRLAEA
ncbi:hypothetical protein AB0C29_43465 [Actinoplanes sp. NPDC048791]|uniref:hypothetical protein n=1 Tax=Actinoplanes sp. NPDC048791 TaxID=3154623 RepID=UPI0033FE2C42